MHRLFLRRFITSHSYFKPIRILACVRRETKLTTLTTATALTTPTMLTTRGRTDARLRVSSSRLTTAASRNGFETAAARTWRRRRRRRRRRGRITVAAAVVPVGAPRASAGCGHPAEAWLPLPEVAEAIGAPAQGWARAATAEPSLNPCVEQHAPIADQSRSGRSSQIRVEFACDCSVWTTCVVAPRAAVI